MNKEQVQTTLGFLFFTIVSAILVLLGVPFRSAALVWAGLVTQACNVAYLLVGGKYDL